MSDAAFPRPPPYFVRYDPAAVAAPPAPPLPPPPGAQYNEYMQTHVRAAPAPAIRVPAEGGAEALAAWLETRLDGALAAFSRLVRLLAAEPEGQRAVQAELDAALNELAALQDAVVALQPRLEQVRVLKVLQHQTARLRRARADIIGLVGKERDAFAAAKAALDG